MATGTCGVGGWGGPQPGDPSNNSILTATPAFGGINVAWSMPSTNPFAVAYTKLYRAVSNNFSASLLIAQEAGNTYFDALDGAQIYYYWIQQVSVNGTVGATIGPVSAVVTARIAQVLEMLANQIDSGLLATSLQNKLDQISILNTNLAQEVLDREGGETTLAQAMAALETDMASAHTFILNEIATRTTLDSAMVEQINGVVATLSGSIAAVTVSMNASIDAIEGSVSALYQVKLTVDGQIGGFGLLGGGGEIEAGFDVDTFWIGRTNANRRKPFVITDDVVYIDSAVINALSASKITTGSLTGQTITGGTFQTADPATNPKRVTINESGQNEARFYGDRGDGNVELLASIGITALNSDTVIGFFGNSHSDNIALAGVATFNSVGPTFFGTLLEDGPANQFINYGSGSGLRSSGGCGVLGVSNGQIYIGAGAVGPGVMGLSGFQPYTAAKAAVTESPSSALIGVAGGNGAGVYGRSSTGIGVRGHSTGSNPGVQGTSVAGYGAYFVGNTTRSALHLEPRTSPPTVGVVGDLAIIFNPITGYPGLCHYFGGSWFLVNTFTPWNT